MAHVIAVVVVHGRTLEEVESWAWLNRCLQGADHEGLVLRHVLIYDNSPTAMAAPGVSAPWLSYRHDHSNGGTAAAFAYGALLASRLNCEWMLWIDQDTQFPPGYLAQAHAALRSAKEPPAALIPRVVSGGTQISPAVISNFGVIRPLERGTTVSDRARITAVASGSVVNTAAFAALGPVPTRLWLDGVDHWVFSMLHSKSLPVAMIDCELQHALSLSNLGAMPSWRVVSVLDSELCLLSVLPLAARIAYPYRLLRYLMRIAGSNPAGARAACRWLISRVLGQAIPPRGGTHVS